MPIRPFLDGHRFDPETIRVMGLAFEMALIALRLGDRGNLANEIVARKIIALATAGERAIPSDCATGWCTLFNRQRYKAFGRLIEIAQTGKRCSANLTGDQTGEAECFKRRVP
jgi:hypothetical protein